MLEPSPQYGAGVFRRRLRIRVGARRIDVELEDSNHAFRLGMRHDGERVTAVEPDFVRHPFTTCPESARHYARLVGLPLGQAADVRRMLETRSGCTHLTDMAALALAHAAQADFERLYDIAVDDERDGRSRARIACDGTPVFDWIVAQHTIVEPAACAGRPMMKGFHAWAREAFAGPRLEAAVALQRGYFVAQARRYRTTPERDFPATGDGMPEGVCYSYSTAAVARALRIPGSRRDFTEDASGLLRFQR